MSLITPLLCYIFVIHSNPVSCILSYKLENGPINIIALEQSQALFLRHKRKFIVQLYKM